MSVHAKWKSIKLTGKLMNKLEDGKRLYSIRVEYEKNFTHVPYETKSLDVSNDANDLLVAFRNVLLAANTAVMGYPAFAALMRSSGNEQELLGLYGKTKDMAKNLDELFDIPHEMGFFEMAKGMAYDGVVPPAPTKTN